MKRLIFIITLAFYFAAITCSQDNKDLVQRLENLLETKHRLDIEKIPDYPYPEIFILASRNEIRGPFEKRSKK
jgi:protoheme ferro-lyase